MYALQQACVADKVVRDDLFFWLRPHVSQDAVFLE